LAAAARASARQATRCEGAVDRSRGARPGPCGRRVGWQDRFPRCAGGAPPRSRRSGRSDGAALAFGTEDGEAGIIDLS